MKNQMVNKGEFMKREKQNYLINPVFDNPFEVFSVPRRRVLAEIDSKGRFKRVATIRKGKKSKAKKISDSEAKKLLAKILKSKKSHKKITKKSHKKITKKSHKKHTRKSTKIYPSMITHYVSHKNPLLLVGNPKRRGVMKRIKKGHKNPMFNLIKEREGKELINLAIDGSVIVGGTLIGKFAMDNLSKKITLLQKPIGKIGGHLVLGSAVYVLGSRIKKIPNRITRLLALGIILPAVVDVIDMVKAKVSGVKEIGVDENAYLPETSAYVPETSAYVPETSAYVPETSELGEDSEY
jgi:hypothetical protein